MTDERPGDQPDQPSPDAGTTNDAGKEAGSDAGAASADQSGGWSSFDPNAPGPGIGDASGKKILGQLQAMIDSIATQAAPVAKQIGVKAAELTAVAADRAGPLAHRAGDAAADASGKLAQRSRELAEDLRRELGDSDNGAASDAPDDAAGATGDAGSATAAVMDRPDDAPPSDPAPGPG